MYIVNKLIYQADSGSTTSSTVSGSDSSAVEHVLSTSSSNTHEESDNASDETTMWSLKFPDDVGPDYPLTHEWHRSIISKYIYKVCVFRVVAFEAVILCDGLCNILISSYLYCNHHWYRTLLSTSVHI